MPDASSYTQNVKFAAISSGNAGGGPKKGPSSGGFTAGAASAGRISSTFSIPISEKANGPVVVPTTPTITFVSYTSPNATLAYTTGGKTITEYGFMVGETKYPITNGSRVLKLTDIFFPRADPAVNSTSIDVIMAYLTYDGVDIMSDSRSITLRVTFGTFTLDSHGVATGSYGGDYLPTEVGVKTIMNDVVTYYSAPSVTSSFSVDAFMNIGQNIYPTVICPYAKINGNYYTSSDSTAYDWANYLTFNPTTISPEGTMTMNYTTTTLNNISRRFFEQVGLDSSNTTNGQYNCNSDGSAGLGVFSAAGQSVTNTFTPVIVFGNLYGGESTTFSGNNAVSSSYFWNDYINFQLNINSNGYVSYSIAAGITVNNPVLTGNMILDGLNITATTTPTDVLTPNINAYSFTVTASTTINGNPITATASYIFENYIAAAMEDLGNGQFKASYNTNLANYVDNIRFSNGNSINNIDAGGDTFNAGDGNQSYQVGETYQIGATLNLKNVVFTNTAINIAPIGYVAT